MPEDNQNGDIPNFDTYHAEQASIDVDKPRQEDSYKDTASSNQNRSEKKTKKSRAYNSDMGRPVRVAVYSLAVIVIIFAIVGIFSSIHFLRQHFGKMDNPQEAGRTLIQTIVADDYEKYQSLMSQDEFIREDADLFKTLQANIKLAEDALISNFIMIRLESGKQYLCSIFFDENVKEYRIRQIREVPTDASNIFSIR